MGCCFADTPGVDHLASYRKDAMKLAAITKLGGNEGYVARIPGFRGLLATGRTRKESITELEDALVDWVELALRRCAGLPAVKQRNTPGLTTA
jgi:predicted RNase H-like HicB family nuclease